MSGKEMPNNRECETKFLKPIIWLLGNAAMPHIVAMLILQHYPQWTEYYTFTWKFVTAEKIQNHIKTEKNSFCYEVTDCSKVA